MNRNFDNLMKRDGFLPVCKKVTGPKSERFGSGEKSGGGGRQGRNTGEKAGESRIQPKMGLTPGMSLEKIK